MRLKSGRPCLVFIAERCSEDDLEKPVVVRWYELTER